MRPPTRHQTLIVSITFALLTSVLRADDSGSQSGYGANTYWQTALNMGEGEAPQLLWSQAVGEGRSQVVSDHQYVYVVSGQAPDPKSNPKRLTTTVSALTVQDGNEVWSFEIASERYANQETFSGAKPCPRATPVLHDGRLFAISFSGQLICLDARDGRQLWMIDLVEDLKAEPVQFGFSASVVVDSSYPDRVCVVAAGSTAGFYCFSTGDGSTIWKADCRTPSYATPVIASFGKRKQWVLVTEDEVLGVAADSGDTLWSYELLEPRLTNVPTPLVIDERRLLISGQGCKGTASVQVTKSTDGWNVKQLWTTNRVQFFYTNWMKLNDQVVIGCTDQYLAAISIDTGKLLGRWRGFSDGHVSRGLDGQLFVLGGKGKLNILASNRADSVSQLIVQRQYQLTDRRCWTPLSGNGQQWFVRHDDQLRCYVFSRSEEARMATQLAAEQRILLLKMESNAESSVEETISPVELIFAAFESKGPDVAFQLYGSLRAKGKLDEASRIELIQAARQNDQQQMAAIVLKQAIVDFPSSIKLQALKQR